MPELSLVSKCGSKPSSRVVAPPTASVAQHSSLALLGFLVFCHTQSPVTVLFCQCLDSLHLKLVRICLGSIESLELSCSSAFRGCCRGSVIATAVLVASGFAFGGDLFFEGRDPRPTWSLGRRLGYTARQLGQTGGRRLAIPVPPVSSRPSWQIHHTGLVFFRRPSRRNCERWALAPGLNVYV